MKMQGRGLPSSRVPLYHSAEYFGGSDGTTGPGPPRAEKRGGLKYLVSKFENMASSNKKPAEPPIMRQPNGLGTKGRGWRGAVGFKKKEEITSQSTDVDRQRLDSLEIARSTRADEIKLERKEPSDGSIKSQSSLIVRGKKEGRRLLNGLSGRMSRENKSGSELDPKLKSSRRESLVQLRVRALETVRGPKVAKDKPSVIREEISPYRGPAPPKTSDNTSAANLTPTTTHTQESSGGNKGRQRQKLQKPQPISTKPKKSSNLLPKAETSANVSVASTQLTSVDGNVRKPAKKVLTKKNPPPHGRHRSETSTSSVHDFTPDPRRHQPSEAQVFSLAARPDHGAPRKSVAPTIRERITMFESAKDVKSTSIVALLGAGATAALKRRIADEGAEDGAVVGDIMRRVEYGRSEEKLQSPQMGTMEEPSLTRGSTDRKKNKSPISRYLEERKRSSISTQGSGGDGKINGKYVSSFAARRSGVTSPETTRAVFQAVKATTPKKGSSGFGLPMSISSPAKLGNFGRSAQGQQDTGRNSPALSPHLQDMVLRRQSERNALSNHTSRATSRQPSPHSMDGHNSVVKRPSTPQVVLTGGPVRPPTGLALDLVAPPSAPLGTPPGTIDDRVAELIALAAEDDEPIISKGVAEDYHEIERLGSAMGGMREVPIGHLQHLAPASVGRANKMSVVAARNVAPRTRTPLQRSRSSLSRMLGRDGPAQDREKDDVGENGENKENVPSDEEGKKEDEVKKKVDFGKEVEEERTLVVRSEVVISEPKPLRLVEISRMLRMARFGRSRSGGRLSDIKI